MALDKEGFILTTIPFSKSYRKKIAPFVYYYSFQPENLRRGFSSGFGSSGFFLRSIRIVGCCFGGFRTLYFITVFFREDV